MKLSEIPRASTESLEQRLEALEGDWSDRALAEAEAIDAELDARAYDADDPAAPQNTATDARDNAVVERSYAE